MCATEPDKVKMLPGFSLYSAGRWIRCFTVSAGDGASLSKIPADAGIGISYTRTWLLGGGEVCVGSSPRGREAGGIWVPHTRSGWPPRETKTSTAREWKGENVGDRGLRMCVVRRSKRSNVIGSFDGEQRPCTGGPLALGEMYRVGWVRGMGKGCWLPATAPPPPPLVGASTSVLVTKQYFRLRQPNRKDWPILMMNKK